MTNVKHTNYYMAVAEAAANNSHAERKKVGACLVTKNQVILSGWNGMPEGMDNTCEEVDQHMFTMYACFTDDGACTVKGSPVKEVISYKTRREVIHAEMNAIAKAAREGVSTLGSTLFVTLSPCIECAKMLIAAGVSSVVYKELYRDRSGIELLKKCGVNVVYFGETTNV